MLPPDSCTNRWATASDVAYRSGPARRATSMLPSVCAPETAEANGSTAVATSASHRYSQPEGEGTSTACISEHHDSLELVAAEHSAVSGELQHTLGIRGLRSPRQACHHADIDRYR